jgi:hypothetical protein
MEVSDLLKSFEEHSSYKEISERVKVVNDKITNDIEEIWKSEAFEDM